MCVRELGPFSDLFLLLLGLRLWSLAMNLRRCTPLGRVGCWLVAVLQQLLLDVDHVPWQLYFPVQLLQVSIKLDLRFGIIWVHNVFLGVHA